MRDLKSLSHPLLILYQTEHQMSSFFQSFFIFLSDTFPSLSIWRINVGNFLIKGPQGESRRAPSSQFGGVYFTFILFRSWSHLLSSFFQYFLSSSSVSNRSSGCTDFHDTTFWVSSCRDSNWCRLYPHQDPTVSSTCGTFVTVPPLCRYSSTVSFRIFMFTCSWYG